MRIEVKVPNLPESVSDAVLLDWHKQPGDPVKKTDSLIDLETDKVVLEVPVPENGVLLEILRAKGDVVTSGELLAVIDTEAKPAAAPAQAAAPAVEPAQPSAPPPPATPERRVEYPPTLSPAVRRMLTGHGLDPAALSGTGRDGRLTKEDIQSHLDNHKAAPPAQAATSASQPPPEPAPGTRAADRRVPMTRLRSRIAERMIEAQHSTATLTTFNEVNLQNINELRKRYREKFEQTHKVKLGYMSFFVKAAVEALKRYPIVNSSVDGNDIVYHDYYDIGLAVSTDRGLVVPVLRDADKLDFADIEKAVVEFSKRAREGKLTFEELNGGTFTITNGGTFGSMLSTPILNPPQSAILGMHAIKDRPVVEDGQIVIRPMIYLAMSYDHRIIDGRDAVSCLYAIKELLEDPGRLLLGI